MKTTQVAQASYTQQADIIDTAVAAGDFNTLAAALKAADLIDTLKGEGPFTVFAPTDAAFELLPEGTVQTLLKPENRDQLVSTLTYHVVPGAVKAKKVVGLETATTVNGQRVDIQTRDGNVFIDGARVIKTDILCSNGVIHVIDAVILPESRNIPEVAQSAGIFNTLLAAVTTAELAETLSGKGPFTVFAPTDDAFAKLPEGTVQSLLRPENRDQLVQILTYHVVPGRVYASDVVKLTSATTVEGSNVSVKTRGNTVRINDSKVIKTDIEAS
ncbi:MAG: fasciclin domain-containing protein, partial [Planctomycetota bacterium]